MFILLWLCLRLQLQPSNIIDLLIEFKFLDFPFTDDEHAMKIDSFHGHRNKISDLKDFLKCYTQQWKKLFHFHCEPIYHGSICKSHAQFLRKSNLHMFIVRREKRTTLATLTIKGRITSALISKGNYPSFGLVLFFQSLRVL